MPTIPTLTHAQTMYIVAAIIYLAIEIAAAKYARRACGPVLFIVGMILATILFVVIKIKEIRK